MSYIQIESGAAALRISDALTFFKNKIADYDSVINEITKPVERKFLWFKWIDTHPYDKWDSRLMGAIWNRCDCRDYCKRLNILLAMCDDAPSITLDVKDYKLIH